MNGVTVSAANFEDIPALTELLAFLFNQEADFRPDREKQQHALGMILKDPDSGRIFAARSEGKVVGMVNLLFLISTAEGGKVVQLEDLVVHPGFRKQGVGTLLLQQALTFARQENFSRVTLLTDAHNASAQELYRRHGFEPSAMIPLRLHLFQN